MLLTLLLRIKWPSRKVKGDPTDDCESSNSGNAKIRGHWSVRKDATATEAWKNASCRTRSCRSCAPRSEHRKRTQEEARRSRSGKPNLTTGLHSAHAAALVFWGPSSSKAPSRSARVLLSSDLTSHDACSVPSAASTALDSVPGSARKPSAMEASGGASTAFQE